MNPSRLAEASAGAIGATVGLFVLRFVPLDGLLPLNRMLFALDCALVTMWATLVVAQRWRQGP